MTLRWRNAIRLLVDETGVDPGALELEISEGVAMLDTARSTYPAPLGDPRSLDEGRP